MDKNNLILVEQHFHSNSHDFNRDTKFTITERTEKDTNIKSMIKKTNGGARGIIVIVVGNEHGDTSSNPGRDWLHFT